METLGLPAVSPTLHRDSGAQLVYPAPDDPLVRRDIAVTTGFFSSVGVVRPETTQLEIPSPNTVAEVVEFHHSGVAFLATPPRSDGTCRYASEARFIGPGGRSAKAAIASPSIAAIVEAMTRQGWVDEGSVMCVER